MKRRVFIITVVFLFISGPLWMYLLWKEKEPRKSNVVVLDKTVSSLPAKEHTSIFWVLKNEKFSKADGSYYDPQKDYLGFFPIGDKQYDLRGLEQFSDSAILALATKTDLVYMADGYGIYDYDLNKTSPYINAKKIYGGLSHQDITFLTEMKRQKKKVVAEFNSMNSPSSMQYRLEFQNIFSIRWTGWIGKYFADLSENNDELPSYVTKNYAKKNGKAWPYKGEGILFLHENGDYLVLEYKKDLDRRMPIITSTPTMMRKYKLPNKIAYPFWFEMNLISKKNELISTFQLPTNARGDSLLASKNIMKYFPAAVANLEENQHLYYFCADFADNPVDFPIASLRYIEHLKKIAVSTKGPTKKELFFYHYFLPLFRTILNEK